MNGTSYTYGTKPDAVTAVGGTSYTYDANGNMTGRGGQGLTWDVENRPTAIGTETYVYDRDGIRIEKTVGGVTTLYVISCKSGLYVSQNRYKPLVRVCSRQLAVSCCFGGRSRSLTQMV